MPEPNVFELPWKQDFMRPGERLCIPTITAPLYPLIGAVAIYWGSFEVKMNELLAVFVAADADPNDQHWERRSFAKRLKLLKQKARKHFPGKISVEINSILSSARTYHWQRNLIVHGNPVAVFDAGAGNPYVRGHVNGKYVKMILKEDHLEKMYHEIGFLTGRLVDLTCDEPDHCRLSWQDRSKLRAFVAKHPNLLPNPKTIAPRHPPSPK